MASWVVGQLCLQSFVFVAVVVASAVFVAVVAVGLKAA